MLGQYALLKLPYHDEVRHSHPDGMHLIKNIMAHIMDLMTDRRRAAHPHQVADEVHRAKALERYWLTAEEMREADRRATEIMAPCGSSFNPGPTFTGKNSSLTSTAAIHEVGQLLLAYF